VSVWVEGVGARGLVLLLLLVVVVELRDEHCGGGELEQ